MNRSFSGRVTVAHGEAITVFKELNSRFTIETIFSHEETGLANTFARDKAVLRWVNDKAIKWIETPSGAVSRPCLNRDSWDKDWRQIMRSDLVENKLEKLTVVSTNFDTSGLPNTWKQVDLAMQHGGSTQAKMVLGDFFDSRGKDYHWLISKPLQSQLSCSRMSPYLAWGNISLREMYQHLLSHWTVSYTHLTLPTILLV